MLRDPLLSLILSILLLQSPPIQSILKTASRLPLSFFRWQKIEVPKVGTPQDPSSRAEVG